MQCDIKQSWDLMDDEILAVHDHADQAGLLDRTVHDTIITRETFPLLVRRTECFCAVYEGDKPPRPRGEARPPRGGQRRPLGFFFLSRFEGATARLHLGLTGDDRAAIAGQVLDWCFSTFEFKSLMAAVPAADAETAGLLAALGARRLAEIPGLCWLARRKKTATGILFLFEPPPAPSL